MPGQTGALPVTPELCCCCFVFKSLHSFSYENLENSLRYSARVHVCFLPDIERGGLVQTRVVIRRFGDREENFRGPADAMWVEEGCDQLLVMLRSSDLLLVLTPRICNTTSFRFCLTVCFVLFLRRGLSFRNPGCPHTLRAPPPSARLCWNQDMSHHAG